jgi:transposase-like protein
MNNKRKRYSPEFKLKVVLESLQRDTMQEEVCQKFHQLNTGRLYPQSDQYLAGEPVALVFVVQFLRERRNAQVATLPSQASNRPEASDVCCTFSTLTLFSLLFLRCP